MHDEPIASAGRLTAEPDADADGVTELTDHPKSGLQSECGAVVGDRIAEQRHTTRAESRLVRWGELMVLMSPRTAPLRRSSLRPTPNPLPAGGDRRTQS